MSPLQQSATGARAVMIIVAACFAAAGVFVAGVPAQPAATASPSPAPPASNRTILFFGDSLTAGYGLENPAAEAFPALIRQRLDAAGLNYAAVNLGVSGNTSADGLSRIDWVLRRPVGIFVLELGGNDGLRGLPLEATRRNLQGIIDRARAHNPGLRLVLADSGLPPSLGPDYIQAYAGMFQGLAAANPGASLFSLLEGVGGDLRYNQPDGIHPTAAGHRLIADHFWTLLEPMCRAAASVPP